MEQEKYSRFEGLTKNCEESAKHDEKAWQMYANCKKKKVYHWI